jgi:hypothetical protein
LIKKGHPRALPIVGAGEKAQVFIHDVLIKPQEIQLGNTITLSFRLESTSSYSQRLMVDYIVHYVKKSGESSPKVFKLKELALGPGESASISRAQSIRDFTTRIHHPGRHDVEIVVNGESIAKTFFELSR